MKEVMAFASEK